MAPSPELGQPKAPDKSDSKITTVESNIDSGVNHESAAGTSSQTISSSATLQRPAAIVNNSIAAPAAAATTEQEPENLNINELNETEYKALLDEAFTYKASKDYKNKSYIFKKLLKDSEREDNEKSRTTQTGSLQNIPEAINEENKKSAYNTNSTTSRYNYNKKNSLVSSRQHEGGSLPSNVNVTTAHSDLYYAAGGSGVQNSNDEKFANDIKTRCSQIFNLNIIKNDNKQLVVTSTSSLGSSTIQTPAIAGLVTSVSSTSAPITPSTISLSSLATSIPNSITTTTTAYTTSQVNQGVPRLTKEILIQPQSGSQSDQVIHSNESYDDAFNNNNNGSHMIIDIGDSDLEEIKPILLKDSTAQGLSEPFSSDEGTELTSLTSNKIPRVKPCLTNLEISFGEPARTVHSIDKTLTFDIMENSSKNVDKTSLEIDTSFESFNNIINNYTMNTNNNSINSNNSGNKTEASSSISTATASIILNKISNIGTQKQFQFNPMLQTNLVLDENGNTLQQFNSTLSSSSASTSQPNKPSKVRKTKSERNTVTIDSTQIEGFRGNQDIHFLLSYIENKETPRKNGSLMKNDSKNVLGVESTKTNNKKKGTGRKDNNANSNNKLKKSNSLEELRSCSKLDVEDNQSENNSLQDVATGIVTLRQKNSSKKNSLANDVRSEKSNQQQHIKTQQQQQQLLQQNQNQQKRGERRSWGTEELNYLGDSCVQPKETLDNSVVCSLKEKDNKDKNNKSGKVKDNKDNNVNSVSYNNNNYNVNSSIQCNNNNKNEEHSLSIVSIESISTGSETAEFHVVTKKKKPKKRQNMFNDDSRNNKNFNNNSHHINNNRDRDRDYQSNHRKYNNHTGGSNGGGSVGASNFTNDRDCYVNNTTDNRRKSTSSVPPSDKSDTSDLDSIHSLPIESTTTRQQLQTTSISNGSTPQVSYADIARISNPYNVLNTQKDKWPSVSPKATLNNNDTGDTISIGATPQSGSHNITNNYNAPNKNQYININNTNNNGRLNKLYSESIDSTATDVSSCSSTSSSNTVVKQTPIYSQYPAIVTDENKITLNGPTSIVIESNSKKSVQAQNNNNNLNSSVNKQMVVPSHSSAAQQVVTALSRQSLQPIVSVATISTTTSSQIVQQPLATQNMYKITDIAKHQPQPVEPTTIKTHLHKSKSVENESYYNIDQYPALEKTVKPQKYHNVCMQSTTLPLNPSALGVVALNSSSLVSAKQPQIDNSSVKKTKQQIIQINYQKDVPVSLYPSIFLNTKTVLTTNHCDQIVDVNNAKNTLIDTTMGPSIFTSTTSSIPSTTTSPQIINSLQEQRPQQQTPSTILEKQNVPKFNNKNINSCSSNIDVVLMQQLPTSKATTTLPTSDLTTTTIQCNDKITKLTNNHNKLENYNTNTGKRKKEKYQQNDTIVNNRVENHNNNNANHHYQHTSNNNQQQNKTLNQNRPAVIILNDNDRSQPIGCGITFGFDINKQLLFGDSNDDEILLFDQQLELSPSSISESLIINSCTIGCNNNNNDVVNKNIINQSDNSLCDNTISISSSVNINNNNNISNNSNCNNSSIKSSSDIINTSNESIITTDYGYTSTTSSINNNINNSTNSIEFNCDNNIFDVVLTQKVTSSDEKLVMPRIIKTITIPTSVSPSTVTTTNELINNNDNDNLNNNNNNINNKTSAYLTSKQKINDNCSNINNVVNSSNNNSNCLQILSTDEKTNKNASDIIVNNTNNDIDNINNNLSNNNNNNNLTEIKNKPLKNCVNDIPTTTATATTTNDNNEIITTKQQESWDNALSANNNNNKEINLRFVAPATQTSPLSTYNHDKIVNFVRLAWENIICGANSNAQYYDGQ